MKDYYKILGVDEEASEEEIRVRWVELSKQYHPDLTQENGAEARLKEINEAYHILKDQSKRIEYDLERLLKKKSIRRSYDRIEKRARTRKVMFYSGVILAILIIGLAGMRRFFTPSSPPSQALLPIERVHIPEKILTPPSPPSAAQTLKPDKPDKPDRPDRPDRPEKPDRPDRPDRPEKPEEKLSRQAMQTVQLEKPLRETPQAPATRETSLNDKILVVKEAPIPQESPPVEKSQVSRISIPIEEAPAVTKTPTIAEPPAVKETPQKILPPSSPAPPQTQEPSSTVRALEKPVEKPSPKIEEKPREVPKITTQTLAKEDLPKDIPKPAPAAALPAPARSLPPPPIAKEEEVKKFFSDYIDRYNQKEVDRFLSLFSLRALQNQKDGMERIRTIYTDFFHKSREVQYHLERMNMEISSDRVDVKGQYQVRQILKKGGQEKIYRGKIHWVLVKEEGGLRILTLDYQHER